MALENTKQKIVQMGGYLPQCSEPAWRCDRSLWPRPTPPGPGRRPCSIGCRSEGGPGAPVSGWTPTLNSASLPDISSWKHTFKKAKFQQTLWSNRKIKRLIDRGLVGSISGLDAVCEIWDSPGGWSPPVFPWDPLKASKAKFEGGLNLTEKKITYIYFFFYCHLCSL